MVVEAGKRDTSVFLPKSVTPLATSYTTTPAADISSPGYTPVVLVGYGAGVGVTNGNPLVSGPAEEEILSSIFTPGENTKNNINTTTNRILSQCLNTHIFFMRSINDCVIRVL